MTFTTRRRALTALAGITAVCAAIAGACSPGSDTSIARWELDGATAADATTLPIVVGVGSSNCGRLHDVDVTEDDQTVTITATVTMRHSNCNLDYRYEPVTVTLEQPLGDRLLVGCEPSPVPGGPDCRASRR